MYAQQHIDRVPRHEADLRGAWLNAGIKHRNLGVDFSAAGDDMTPVNPTDLQAERVGCTFGGTNGYLRRAEANWRSGDSQGTILAWVRRTVVGNQQAIFGSADEPGLASNIFALYYSSSNKLRVRQKNDDTEDIVEGSTTIGGDEWFRVAVVSSGSTYTLNVKSAPIVMLSRASVSPSQSPEFDPDITAGVST